MIKVSFELVNDYARGWHEVTENMAPMFENIWVFEDVDSGKKDDEGNPAMLTAEEQLRHFNDHYLDYTLKNGKLFFDENHKGFEKEAQRQTNLQVAAEIKEWFVWYDNQDAQAARAQRTGTEWHAVDGERMYHTLAELDTEANKKQNQIRALRVQG